MILDDARHTRTQKRPPINRQGRRFRFATNAPRSLVASFVRFGRIFHTGPQAALSLTPSDLGLQVSVGDPGKQQSKTAPRLAMTDGALFGDSDRCRTDSAEMIRF